MQIGLIGTGKIGACLALKFKDAGHTVRIANSRGPETLADLAKEVGAMAVSVVDVAKQSDVLIISVPMKAIQQFPASLPQKPVQFPSDGPALFTTRRADGDCQNIPWRA
jgi:predicted dinucleotide-binding enzyme